MTPAAPARARLDSLDALRGLVMVLMLLDHTRDFFHFGAQHGADPLDLAHTTVPLFFTRWITHCCAPAFVLLAGAGAFLSGTRGKSRRELSWFLLTRGLWLVVLEVTYVQWAGWDFAVNLHRHYALVVWALGWSMVVLAALVHLPQWAVTAFGVAMIAGHNALDGVKPEALGAFGPAWRVLHAGGPVEIASGHTLAVGYPLIPWIGVMAAGYGLGAVFVQPAAVNLARFGRADWLYDVQPGLVPASAGFGLGGTCLAGLAALVLLYPVCGWFANVKRQRRDAWLSYL